MAEINSSSLASFTTYNGGSSVAGDSAGNLDIHAPGGVRFILQSVDGSDYVPVGISFQQTGGGTADPGGKRNFSTRTISDGVLTVMASEVDADTFDYSIVFKRSADGALGQIGIDGRKPVIRGF